MKGHKPAAPGWPEPVREGVLREALKDRDGKLGDGRARVHEAEFRDADRRLPED